MKKILIAFIIMLALGGAYWYTLNKSEPTPTQNGDDARVIPTDGETEEENLTGEVFGGKLQEVNVGCFADGECYVVVDGKHVTTIMGWSQRTVGSIIGVEGFGDLEGYIGKDVEVHAYLQEDGTYTLYGNKDFYVKVK